MGVRLPGQATVFTGNVALFTNVESLIVTAPALNVALDFAQVLLFWYFVVQVGTGTTSLTVRIRRGSTTGAAVNVPTNVNVTAGNTVAVSGVYADTPGAIAGLQYVLTGLQNAATGNGTCVDYALIAASL